MVKSYLRYERESSFGVIAALEGNVIYDHTGRYAIAPALKDIVVWNIRQGNKVRELRGESGQVTALTLSPDGTLVAAGYSTGVVRIFKLATGALEVTLDGHKSAVEALAYKSDGSMLASGARDTDIIVWDIVSQTGLFRLKGHKDAVTALKFAAKESLLVSSSKDTLVKVWDLETQHCVQTCVGHRNEVWSFDVNPAGDRLITGSSDNQLRVWSLRTPAEDEQVEAANASDVIQLLGSIYRQSNDRAMHVAYNPQGNLVGVQGAGKTVEIYKLRSLEEIKKKQQRREKRQREKAKKKQEAQKQQQGKQQPALVIPAVVDEEDKQDNSATDELELLCVVRSSHKIKSFAFSPDVAKDGTSSLLLGLQNNSIETFALSPAAQDIEARYSKAHSLTLSGHRSDVRFVAVSSDDQLLLSLSSSSVKIWNARSMQCIRTLSEGISLALCAVFAPGNMHVVVGTKLGALLLFDLNSGECIWKEDTAHNGSAVWSIDVRPDGKGIATGGADQHVNFWDFEMYKVEENSEGLRLGLSHSRLLKMSDDVLCVRFSNTKDAKKLVIAVALLDCTVKVFHDDSLKFFVSLYGHKLPVMSMDISSDDTMIVTASADKNVKLWGLDFGDCHKSIFAHQDSIMAVRFVQKTHYFFTASKDKTICYWDGDHFERILKIDNEHFGEVWGLAVSNDGSFVVSCSQDRSICKYVRTEDQVFIEEEREKEMEQMFEEELQGSNRGKKPAMGKEKGENEEEDQTNSASATKKTVESVRAGESLMEAIELAENEFKAIAEHEKLLAKKKKEAKLAKKNGDEEAAKIKLPTRTANIILLGYSPLKYVLNTMRRIRPHEMEEALIVLPFEYVEKMIDLLLQMISSHLEVEFCCNVLLVLLKLHHTAICNRPTLLNALELLWQRLRQQLTEKKNRIGFNLAGMKYLKRQIDEERTGFVQEIAAPAAANGSNKKRKKTSA